MALKSEWLLALSIEWYFDTQLDLIIRKFYFIFILMFRISFVAQDNCIK